MLVLQGLRRAAVRAVPGVDRFHNHLPFTDGGVCGAPDLQAEGHGRCQGGANFTDGQLCSDYLADSNDPSVPAGAALPKALPKALPRALAAADVVDVVDVVKGSRAGAGALAPY